MKRYYNQVTNETISNLLTTGCEKGGDMPSTTNSSGRRYAKHVSSAFLSLALVTMLTVVLPAEDVYAQNSVRNVPFSTPYYTYTLQSGIVYGKGKVNGGGSFKNLTLDLYIPDIPAPVNAINKLPLMLMIHGGGFTTGNKTNANVVAAAREYAERGWLVASINYRLQGDNPVPSSRVQALYDAAGGASADLYTRTAISAVDDALTALDFLQARNDIYSPWTTLWGSSAGAFISLATAYCLDDYGIARPPVGAVFDESGSFGGCAIGTPFDDPTGSDPVLMIVHGTSDPTVPFSEALAIRDWATSAGLPLDFQPVTGAGHVPNLFNNNASTGVTLYQRSVDFQHETIFAGLEQGPQPPLPPGC